jgi:hypothetical protein
LLFLVVHNSGKGIGSPALQTARPVSSDADVFDQNGGAVHAPLAARLPDRSEAEAGVGQMITTKIEARKRPKRRGRVTEN